MDREQVIKILSYLRVAYPNFYKGLSKRDAEETIAVWQDLFIDCDFNLVFIAVKEIINTSDNPYPPTISEIKQKMYDLTTETKTPSDLWNELIKALRNSGYHAEEQYMKLSPEVKAFVRNPSQLKEMAMMDSDVINSVTKGQFFKQIEVIQKRVKEDKQMLPEAREFRKLAMNIGQDISGLLD